VLCDERAILREERSSAREERPTRGEEWLANRLCGGKSARKKLVNQLSRFC
jgi:hypothetical protein